MEHLEVDVAVLGAGPAGVGAAWRAARKGARVAVLERAGVPGGAAGSFTVGGMRVDHGSHRLHQATEPEVLAELRALLGDELQERPRNGRIRLAGRWIGFPLRPGDLVRRLPPSFAAGAAFDAATAGLRSPRRDTFDEVVRAGLGPTMWRRFYGPYARKIWGVEPALLSGEQARRRVSADSPAKIVKRILSGAKGGPATFFYPRDGFGAITERLAEAASQAGAQLRYETGVSGLAFRNTHVDVTTTTGTTVKAGRVWSTVPLTVLARMAEPAPPPAVIAGAQALQFRSLTLAYLVLDVDQWTPFDAHYLPELSTPVSRISEPKNYRDGDDPPGRTVLCAEIPCRVGDRIWSASEPEIAKIVTNGIAGVALPAVQPVEVVVRRLSHAYPIYTTGYEEHFAALDAWAQTQPRLLTFGRQGLFAHDNTHHALAMAWAASAALDPDGTFDDPAWAAARERFRDHVVED